MRDFVEFIFIVSIVFTLVMTVILGFSYLITSYSCNAYGNTTGKETKMVALDCYIEEQGNWYVWEEYKYRLVAKGEIAK